MLNKIKQIKYSRLSPNERYLTELFEGVVMFKHKQYPKSTYYIKNDIIMFEIDDKYIMIDGDILWKDISKSLILPIKTGINVEKELLNFFVNHFTLPNYILYTRSRFHKSWKHIKRSVNSIGRKEEYVK